VYAPAGLPAPHVGYSTPDPPDGTKTVEVLVMVVNQHAKAVEDGVMTRLTLPENPLTLVTVTTVCLSEATGIAWEVGFSVMAKSPEVGPVTIIATLMLCEIEPLTPINVSV
jgi:hypothetical protein